MLLQGAAFSFHSFMSSLSVPWLRPFPEVAERISRPANLMGLHHMDTQVSRQGWFLCHESMRVCLDCQSRTWDYISLSLLAVPSAVFCLEFRNRTNKNLRIEIEKSSFIPSQAVNQDTSQILSVHFMPSVVCISICIPCV